MKKNEKIAQEKNRYNGFMGGERHYMCMEVSCPRTLSTQMTWPGLEPGPPDQKSSTQQLGHCLTGGGEETSLKPADHIACAQASHSQIIQTVGA